MKKDIVIFGIGKIAEVIYYYAVADCGFSVAAFCVDEQYKNVSTFKNAPVISFEEVHEKFPPQKYDMFVAIGYHDLNRLREKKCKEAIDKGYALVSIISPHARVPSDIKYGWNCFIMPPSLVHPCVTIGNNVFVFSGAMLAHHSIVEDNCWLTSACNISGNVQIGANTFVAVNATVGHSVSIGKNCFLGANTLLTKNLEDDKVIISESNKPLRLTSSQFLRMSSFSNL
jgi:sugar O-acyltransferase (sialic acid O-acetyltransferase NeuD family)